MVCKRCGKCCETMVNHKGWETAPLNPMEKQLLIATRSGYYGCEMLVYEDNKAACLIHKMFGKDKKPEGCRNYDNDGKCEGNKNG